MERKYFLCHLFDRVLHALCYICKQKKSHERWIFIIVGVQMYLIW